MRRRASVLRVPESVARLVAEAPLQNGDGSAMHAHNAKMIQRYSAQSAQAFVPDVPGHYIVRWNADGTFVVGSAPEGSKWRRQERPWHARHVEPTG